jgi:hypothetical protein
MHSVRKVLPSLVIGALVASCGTNPVAVVKNITADDPAAPYLGMHQSEVIACAGQPHSQYRSGDNAETLTYRYSGAGPRPGADTKKWTCTANLLFDKGRLARVSFAHRDARSPNAHLSEKDPEKAAKMKAEGSPTCVFAPPNCRR